MLARCVFARGGKGGATTRKTFDCDAKDKRTLKQKEKKDPQKNCFANKRNGGKRKVVRLLLSVPRGLLFFVSKCTTRANTCDEEYES